MRKVICLEITFWSLDKPSYIQISSASDASLSSVHTELLRPPEQYLLSIFLISDQENGEEIGRRCGTTELVYSLKLVISVHSSIAG